MLQSYFQRFNAEVSTVRRATDETIKNFLIAGVKVRIDFWKNLIPLKLGEFDIILGMYCLADHDAKIECKNKKI